LAAILAQAQPERPGFQLVLDALAYLQVVARAYEAQLLVVIQPSKEMTYLLHHDETAPDPSRALRQALEQHGVESLDLTPNFQQWASTGEPLFFTANRYPNAQGQALNRYPNAQGQALIAQEVVRHLTAAAQTYGLIP